MKILHLDNLNNFRDIANDSVREGVLLRSAKIDDLTDEGRDLLVNKYNVKTIIDLRTLSETKEQIAPDGVEFFNVSMTKTPIFGITKYKKGFVNFKNILNMLFVVRHVPSIPELYENLITPDTAEAWQQLFDVILNAPDGAILMYCEQGKDRTGLLCAFIEYCLGYSEREIVADYVETSKFTAPRGERAYKKARRFLLSKKFAGKLRDIYRADENDILSVFEKVKDRYGSIEEFLHTVCGMTEEKIVALNKKFKK